MMTRRNNVAARESNDNIDHKNMVITWHGLHIDIGPTTFSNLKRALDSV